MGPLSLVYIFPQVTSYERGGEAWPGPNSVATSVGDEIYGFSTVEPNPVLEH